MRDFRCSRNDADENVSRQPSHYHRSSNSKSAVMSSDFKSTVTSRDDPMGAAHGGDDLVIEGRGGVRGCWGPCFRWSDELRESLHGRRLFTLFALVNLVNYMDRGVIPGGSEEFNVFIERKLHTDRPDVFLGVLQSIFILGFSIACLVFARLARFHSPFTLMSAGLGAWCVSAVMAGLARPFGSYFFLLFARLLSGIGEASFVTVVPPLITETAPPGERGVWLALFYTAMPVGAGIGYVYGSVLATSSLGWEWAFYFEALVMAPLALACGLVPHEDASSAPNSADYGTSSLGTATAAVPKQISSSPAELNSLSYRASQSHGDSREQLARRRLNVGVNSPDEIDFEAERFFVQKSDGIAGATLKGCPSERSIPGEGSTNSAAFSHRRSPSDKADGDIEGEHGAQGVVEKDDRDAVVETGVEFDKESTCLGTVNGSDDASFVTIHASGRSALTTSRLFSNDHPGYSGITTTHNNNSSGDDKEFGNATTNTTSMLYRDLLQVVDRPVFCLVVLGAAANAAVTAGMSTFGTGFVIGLELLKSETAAAATFGAVICAAGVVGTPAGGALIDSADPEGRLGDEKKLSVVMRQAFLLVCAATGILLAATVQVSLIPFLGLFFVGATLLFAYTPHMNLAVMLAAPKHLRPLAIAINSVMLHALGDVPSPTIIGAIKDALAPHCAASPSDDNDSWTGPIWPPGLIGVPRQPMSVSDSPSPFDADTLPGARAVHGLSGMWDGAEALGGSSSMMASAALLTEVSDACRSEQWGLHLTLFIMSAWLLWACFFFLMARLVQQGGLDRGIVPVTWIDVRGLTSEFFARVGRMKRRLCCRCHPNVRNDSPLSGSGKSDCKSWFGYGGRRLGLGTNGPRSCRASSAFEGGEGEDDEGASTLEQPLLVSKSSINNAPSYTELTA